MYTYVYIYIYTCMHVMYVMYIYIYIYIHTHMHVLYMYIGASLESWAVPRVPITDMLSRGASTSSTRTYHRIHQLHYSDTTNI